MPAAIPSYRNMSVKDWIDVESNPIQRDTERHAVRAHHLKTPHPTHAFVFAAELPSGKLVKLDGHTRALLWKRKEVDAPSILRVGVIGVKDRAEAEQLYKDFDSRDALETMKDKVSGAFNRHNFEPKSGLLQGGYIVQALRLAYGILIGGTVKTFAAGGRNNRVDNSSDRRTDKQIATAGADIYTMIDEFSYELHALDAFGLGAGQITAGIMGAFLISYRRYGHRVTPFWQGVFGDKGSKISGEMDGIQAVTELMLSGKGQSGKMFIADQAARTLAALEGWLKDKTFARRPSPLDTTDYLVGHEQPNERLIKKKDVKPRETANA